MTFKSPDSAGESAVTAGFLIIGNEILSGRTKDKNLSVLAAGLGNQGIALREVRIVPDNEAQIIEAVREMRNRFSYLFTSGGIGPTHDDITVAAVAKALGRKLVRRKEILEMLRDHYRGSAHKLNPARLKMADAPEGASLVPNPVSKAPGFSVENIHMLAGVPVIFRTMLESLLLGLPGGKPVSYFHVKTWISEGSLAEEMARIEADFSVEVGSYPFYDRGTFGTTVVVSATDADLARKAGEALLKACLKSDDSARLREGYGE